MRVAVRLCMRAATLSLGATSACIADEQPQVCPDVDAGALVITEVRGPQSGSDTRGEWIEIANVSGAAVDLHGLHVVNRELDSSNEVDAIVRYKRELAADDRFVVGLFEDNVEARPPWIDYGFGPDWGSSIVENGFLELRGCGDTLDEIVYRDLPTLGTYSLGLNPPDAEANDDSAAWCTDVAARRIVPPLTELGKPGSPGEVNASCQ